MNNQRSNDAKKLRPRPKDRSLVRLSSGSPLQRKGPKLSNDGPLRSKLAPLTPRQLNFKAGTVVVDSQAEDMPEDDVIMQLFEAAASSPPLESSAMQTAYSVLPEEVSISPKKTHKRRRDSAAEHAEEIAIFTEASTQHRHFITVNSLREVIAQKRAKLTHTNHSESASTNGFG